ncbi:uncharacterized protein ATC70_004645 [Mucor velutinosus]|uniref:PIPK domain-containing protein n=1 Tax=Mucor velutinosus TaxID=708070 RepID=A0AAN7DRJ4_9FUNG|nr:hypothetical protein ATC70_004645 [Mucor velutinosus]
MKSIKAGLSAPKEESNAAAEKRLSKPLPIKPLPTPPSALIIDDTSRNHITKLILTWLNNLSIPIKPWAEVLNKISIEILQKLFDSDNSSRETNKHICIEMLYVNAPKDSKFLANVMHGPPIHDGEHTMHFPIGGTIRIYGLNANDETFTKTLIELVQSLVYLTYSLYLEAYVMRDSHVKLAISTAAPNTPNTATTMQTATESSHADMTTKLSSHHIKKTTDSSGLFGWLKKLATSRDLPTTPPPSIDSEKTVRRKSNPLATVRRGLSLNNLSKKLQQAAATTTDATTVNALPFDFDTITEGDPHRFCKLKKRIEFALISSSPECHFPYPNLLNRLETEENMMIEQKRLLMLQEESMAPVADIARPLSKQQQRRRSSLVSSFSQSVKRSTIVPEAQLPQSITAYVSIRIPTLLADSRHGLEHLLLDTTSLNSFKQHQSITIGFTCYPIGCPDRPCLGPLMSKIDYFRYESPVDSTTTLFPSIDQSLGHTIRHWCNQSQSSCQLHIDEQAQFIPNLLNNTPNPLNNSTQRPDTLHHEKPSESSIYTLATPLLSSSRSSTMLNNRQCSKFHGCQQPLIDHIFSFTHGIGRINVYASTESTCVMREKDRIVTWLVCSVCDASTRPLLLSNEAASFSFAKYLELLFYSTKLASPESFCAHTTSTHATNTKSIISRCFLYNGIAFKFTYEDAKYYELRAPRIQIAPETLVGDKLTFVAPRVGVSTLMEWKHKSAERDVDLFFQSIRAHLDLLNHYTIAESKRKARILGNETTSAKQQLQSESRALDLEIKGLSKRLDADHQAMLYALSDTSLNELNDFRRYFAIQSESIIRYLTDWQQLKCDEVTDACGWDSPDYISQKTVHCFPGSSVLVREDEPTSIIAYSLSSNDYIQEILHDEDTANHDSTTATTNSSSKNPSIPSLSSTNTTESSRTTAEPPPPMPNSAKKKLPQLPNIIDGYYSSIERKYISPSTGATSETASFRTMITEVVKSSVVEVSINNSKRLEDLKARLSPWTKKQEETKLENAYEGADLKRDLTERTLKPLAAVQQQEETREVKVASYFYENADQQPVNGKKMISPHIKHKFVHEGIEFTCIIYYAKEFEMLRRQCNINQLMIESLCRCQTWTASGGKSKSHFYKTQDDRFVIKEMMNAWNVAEKDAFLKFAPKYFDHVNKSANEPSVLAKIFGFFTIRMKNAADKKSILNLDLLVMEHLFFHQNIIRRFDFKGIQDRHVEEFRKQQNDTTLWDGDWLNEYRTRLPVHEQSKSTMELAIISDTDFLSRCNIMDYSLLVGIDQSNSEMTVGIVDFIGAYTWYKKLESKSKSTLQPRKEVTVVPPDQYKHRFCREVCDYFVAVPGKFDLVIPSKCLPSLLI